jgi:hypothetical protein
MRDKKLNIVRWEGKRKENWRTKLDFQLKNKRDE